MIDRPNEAMEPSEKATKVMGVLFSRSVRSSFASLSLVATDECGDTSFQESKEDDDRGDKQQVAKQNQRRRQVLLVRIQFSNDDTTEVLRSYCRRTFKIGDLIRIPDQQVDLVDHSNAATLPDSAVLFDASATTTANCKKTTEWTMPRIVVECDSLQDVTSRVQVHQSRAWTMKACQDWQAAFFPRKNAKKDQESKNSQSATEQQIASSSLPPSESCLDNHPSNHGGGLGKRIQGQHIAEFLIDAIVQKLQNEQTQKVTTSTSSPTTNRSNNSEWRHKAIEFLNAGSGVVDVAGGSGHVSMALGLAGVKSTVIDARESVGKLPGRDRKIWKRALKQSQRNENTDNNNDQGGQPPIGVAAPGDQHNTEIPTFPTNPENDNNNNNEHLVCRPVVPFQAYRSWFGFARPDGVDATFRHPDEKELPVCNYNSSDNLIQRASAIVALHPDEATGDVVKIAVQHKIPFVIVPCCVFARLFPHRTIMLRDGSNSNFQTQQAQKNRLTVTSYDDLLLYLLGQDETIQRTRLPFEGKNIALWSTF